MRSGPQWQDPCMSVGTHSVLKHLLDSDQRNSLCQNMGVMTTHVNKRSGGGAYLTNYNQETRVSSDTITVSSTLQQ
jgi:hypothetical protein